MVSTLFTTFPSRALCHYLIAHIPMHSHSVKMCIPMDHPNVVGQSLCLSMLRRETGNVPYEGWSGAYSATSVLMQLQSFLFADRVDQDEGHRHETFTGTYSVLRTLRMCRDFQCAKCSHSHYTPFPPVKCKAMTLRKRVDGHGLRPVGDSYEVTIDGTNCQTAIDQLGSDEGTRSSILC